MIKNNQDLKMNLKKVSHELRLGKEVEGSHLLKICLNYLIPIVQNHKNKQQILTLVPAMLNAQERGDWLGLADTLEYELVAKI